MNDRSISPAWSRWKWGKLIAEARFEVSLSADILDYYADRAEAYLKPQPIPEAPDATVETLPLGIIVCVEPWNFPYYQLARVAGPQLVVGNVLVAKHAKNVPQCALAFANLFDDAGAPKGAYTNIFASVEQVGRLIEDVRVRGVTLTGSERAGAAVAEQTGRALKKSVMELGGSDPLIVLEDAPLEPTLANAIWGRMNNTGQSCWRRNGSSWPASSLARRSWKDLTQECRPCGRAIQWTRRRHWARCRRRAP